MSFPIQFWVNLVSMSILLGMSPLHLASWAGKTEIAKLLVDARACVNTCADSGDTPLHLACQHCNAGVVSTLCLCEYMC